MATVLVAGLAWAWTASTVNTASVTAENLATPASPSAVRTGGVGDNCTAINVTWTAVTGATSYRVERNVDGVWVELAANHVTTSYGDTGTWTNYEIHYRITPQVGNWSGAAPAIASIACGTGDVDDLTFTFATSCISTQLNWTAPLGTVTGYDVEYRMDGGAWTAVAGGTNIATTTFTDSTVYTTAPHGDLEYRVIARNGVIIGSPSNVVAPTTNYGCLVAPTAVDATGCLVNNRTVTWTAAPSPVTGYDVMRQVNGGGFTTVMANVAGTSWNDTFSVTAGQLVDYNLYSRNGALIDNVTSTTDSMRSGFYVQSVVLGGSANGTLDVGDTITVTFSQPVAPGRVTATQVRTVAGTGSRGLWIASTGGTAGTTDIANARTLINHFTSGTAEGTVAWNSNRTVWTWTATVTGGITEPGGPFVGGTWTVGTSGTSARCFDTTTALGTPDPTFVGGW